LCFPGCAVTDESDISDAGSVVDLHKRDPRRRIGELEN
jgi:hypothetical protein